MPIVLTPHCRWQTARRGVMLGDLLDALAAPEQIVPLRPGRQVQQRRLAAASGRARLLRAVVERDPAGDVVAITVYATSRVAKHWRSP